MYFRLGGGTLNGVSHPGEIVWSRIYIQDNELRMDLGRGGVVELPVEETQRRWRQPLRNGQSCTLLPTVFHATS